MPSSSKAGGHGGEKHLVCVTGAGSFIGSWVVKELLDRGYHVRGTARDPGARAGGRGGDEERDQRGGGRGRAARGVHLLLRRRAHGPQPEPGHGRRRGVLERLRLMQTNRDMQNMYCCGKMMAEIVATEEAAKRGLELAVVVPAPTVGPLLQQTVNFSTDHVARYLTGAKKAYTNVVTAYTDVRDVARAHPLVYEHPDSPGRRYLCVAAVLHRAQFLQLLRDLFPHYPVTSKYEDDGKPMARPYKFSNKRLKDLGLEFTPVRESLYDTVISLQQKGHIPLSAPVPKRARL